MDSGDVGRNFDASRSCSREFNFLSRVVAQGVDWLAVVEWLFVGGANPILRRNSGFRANQEYRVGSVRSCGFSPERRAAPGRL